MKPHRVKVLEIGPVSSTAGVGGVSIHVDRLLAWLKDSGHAEVLHHDYKRSILNLSLIKKMSHCKVVHIHVSNSKLRFVYVLMAKAMGAKVVSTLHCDVARYRGLDLKLLEWTIRMSDRPLMLNRHSMEIAKMWNTDAELVSAFIPEKDGEPLPVEVLDRIRKQRVSGRIIIATNAYRRVFDAQGNEIYGIGGLLAFMTKHTEYCLTLSDPSGEYLSYYENFPDNVEVITVRHSFCEVVKQADAVVRNTSTDGDSISVRESLYLGTPVVASDCVNRPEGTYTFPYNDMEAMEVVLKSALDAGVQTLSKTDTVARIEEIYRELNN